MSRTSIMRTAPRISGTSSAVTTFCEPPSSDVVTRKCRGGSHTSMRPRPSHWLPWTKAVNSPPTRRSPSTLPYQRAKRSGSMSADQTSSMSDSYLLFIRTTPLPSTECNVPSMAFLVCSALVCSVLVCSVIARSFVLACLGQSRCAERPCVASKEICSDRASRRPLRAAPDASCRSGTGPPGAPRRARRREGPAGVATRPDERLAAALQARWLWQDLGSGHRGWSSGSGPRALARQHPPVHSLHTGYVPVKGH